MQHDIIYVLIPPGMWRDARGDGTKLHCVISISETMMHLEAIQVQHIGDELQPINPEFADDLLYLRLFGNERTFQTTQIGGNSYVLAATPFT